MDVKKSIFWNIATGALAGGLGIFLYDFTNKQNLKKLDDALERLMSWEPDWDAVDPQRLPQEALKVFKAVEELDKTHAAKKRHIILVRHGQPGPEGISQMGKQQVQVIADVLRSRLSGIPVRCIVSADTREATSSADIFAKVFGGQGGPVRLSSPIFNEGIGATPEPPTAAEIEAKDTERFEDAFFSFFRRSRKPASDGRQETSAQLEECADMIVTHGNVIRHFLCLALQLDSRAWLRFAVNNGGFVWLEVDSNGRVTARSIGNDSIIPRELITYS